MNNKRYAISCVQHTYCTILILLTNPYFTRVLFLNVLHAQKDHETKWKALTHYDGFINRPRQQNMNPNNVSIENLFTHLCDKYFFSSSNWNKQPFSSNQKHKILYLSRDRQTDSETLEYYQNGLTFAHTSTSSSSSSYLWVCKIFW